MKQITTNDIKKAISDRWWISLVIVNVLVAIIVSVIIIISIEPKETQVITHYSSYGITTFYRDYWYHLIGYILLALIMAVTNTLLSLKLMQVERRDLALALLWASIGMLGILLIFALSIIRIAALG